MKQYLDMCKYVLEHGEDRQDRTGTGTRSVFGYQTRYDLREGFPLMTTKKMFLRPIAEELLWFIKGDTNIKYLVGSTSIDTHKDIVNKHFNECYIITKNIDMSDIVLQKEEVSEVRYFSKDELLKRISNSYEGLTTKTGPWNFLRIILEKYIETV